MNVDVVKEEKIQIGKTYIIVTQWSTELPELFVNYNKPTVTNRPIAMSDTLLNTIIRWQQTTRSQ